MHAADIFKHHNNRNFTGFFKFFNRFTVQLIHPPFSHPAKVGSSKKFRVRKSSKFSVQSSAFREVQGSDVCYEGLSSMFTAVPVSLLQNLNSELRTLNFS